MRPCTLRRPCCKRGAEAPHKAGRRVREPSFVTHADNELPASGTARFRTTCRSKPKRISHAMSAATGRWPGRSGAAGSAASRGAKHRAAGIARRAFPWRQAQCAAPQARRREGLKPNGRDGKDGTGRSPKARRRIAPTRSTMMGMNSDGPKPGSTDGRKVHP
jgi:hypothetical protein